MKTQFSAIARDKNAKKCQELARTTAMRGCPKAVTKKASITLHVKAMSKKEEPPSSTMMKTTLRRRITNRFLQAQITRSTSFLSTLNSKLHKTRLIVVMKVKKNKIVLSTHSIMESRSIKIRSKVTGLSSLKRTSSKNFKSKCWQNTRMREMVMAARMQELIEKTNNPALFSHQLSA